MTQPSAYTPSAKWIWEPDTQAPFANLNRPVAGATHESDLPVGSHPLQLYSLASPNGTKVSILLEELLACGFNGAEYDAWLIRINEGDQFGSGFVEVSPNSKIPVLVDRSSQNPVRVFESGSILLYLAEKFQAFIPKDHAARTETLNWLFWQMASTPYIAGGGFSHFYSYAPEKNEYAINRYAMETKRLFDVLDRQLSSNRYVSGSDYTIADIAIWPWFGLFGTGIAHDMGVFLSVDEYHNVRRWSEDIAGRPAVQRGRMVNRTWGPSDAQLHERHSASDFDIRTQAKIVS